MWPEAPPCQCLVAESWRYMFAGPPKRPVLLSLSNHTRHTGKRTPPPSFCSLVGDGSIGACLSETQSTGEVWGLQAALVISPGPREEPGVRRTGPPIRLLARGDGAKDPKQHALASRNRKLVHPCNTSSLHKNHARLSKGSAFCTVANQQKPEMLSVDLA